MQQNQHTRQHPRTGLSGQELDLHSYAEERMAEHEEEFQREYSSNFPYDYVRYNSVPEYKEEQDNEIDRRAHNRRNLHINRIKTLRILEEKANDLKVEELGGFLKQVLQYLDKFAGVT